MTPSLSGKDILKRLRQEQFNVDTELKLRNHLYIKDAEAGELSLKQKRAFCIEQYSIQCSDAISFASLAGHTSFHPKSLTGIQVPEPVVAENANTKEGDIQNLFQFLLGGEIYAAPMLLKYAKSLGINNESDLAKYEPSPLAQAYPSYWARIGLDRSSTSRAAGAAACAVNFPAWGRMCDRLYNALLSKEDNANEDDLEFIKFFATPIDNLDDMATAIIEEELSKLPKKTKGDVDMTAEFYDSIKNHVRILQQYEVYFWDAIYQA